MKFENTMTHKEAWLKIHKIINDQTKNEFLYIWIQIIIWNENSFNISCQSITILENDLIDRQMLLSQFMIIENEENLYFVDLIDNMKWNIKFTWFELLIKWEKYK